MDRSVAPVLFCFGGVTAAGPDGAVDLGGAKPRGLLALLLVQPGAVVPLDRIIDRMWAGAPPAKAEVSVRGYVSNLRRALAGLGFADPNVIAFRDRGYALDVPADVVDIHRFDALVDRAVLLERDGDHQGARAALDQALDLFVGPPFGSVGEELGLEDVIGHYDERRGQAVELLADARLALGEHAQLPAWLSTEVSRQPYREGLRARLALALHRSGRSVDALRSLDEARRRLGEDVGVEPSAALRELEAAILAQDPALDWTPPVRAERSPAPRVPLSLPTDEARFGRKAEEAQILAAIDRLSERGGVLMISGEAGIGKSSLLRFLRVAAEGRGISVGWDRCPESAAGAPYRSWRSAIGPLLPAGDLHSDVRLPDQEAATALLKTHLGELERLRTLEGPVVVVIDDLQWADDPTLSLLQFLAPELERLQILLAVGVRRSGPLDVSPATRDCLVELSRVGGCVDVRLVSLDRPAVLEWLATRYGSVPSPPVVDHLLDTTAGNPFYLRELLTLLEEDGQLSDDLARGAPLPVPRAVQDVVRRRTSRLPPPTQALLTTAAVVGRRFDLAVLAAVVQLEPAETLARLEPALDDGIVGADETVPGRFAFSHALVSGALEAELNAARAAAQHARVTDAIEAVHHLDLGPWTEDLSFHAAHGLLAGTAPKALTYALRAADAAEAAQSTADVVLQLRRALAASAQLPGFPPVQRRELLLRLGTALRDLGEVEGREMLIEAARLAEVQGDHHALAAILGNLDTESLWAGNDWNLHAPQVVAAVERARAHPQLDDRDRATLTMALAGELTYADNARSNELFAEAEALAEPLGDPVLTARILLQWFWSVSGPSGLPRRAAIGDRLIALDAAELLPTRLRPLAHLSRVSAALEVGEGELARRCVASARALAHPVRTPTGWAHLQYAEAGLALLDGELERARQHAASLRNALRRVRRYTAESSPASILAAVEAEAGNTDLALERLAPMLESPYAGPVHWLEAWILAEAGRHDAASAALVCFDGPLPDDWLRTPLLTAAINAAAIVGDLRFLRRHLPELDAVSGRFAFVGEGGACAGPTSHALAAAHLALGDVTRAGTHAEAAMAICTRMGAVLWTPRVQRLLDRLHARVGN